MEVTMNIQKNAVRTTCIADSNEKSSSYSFSPSELYVDASGKCWEETYSSREHANEFCGDSWEEAGHISDYFESGYWQVSGLEIKSRFNDFLKREEQRKNG
jgi:hypothetical protein